MATYTLTGPSTGTGGMPSTAFTLTPSGSVTDTITFGDGNKGGLFTPAKLTFTASSVAQTFVYASGQDGAITLTLTSSGSLAITGNPATFTASNGGGLLTVVRKSRRIKDLPTVPGYRARHRAGGQ
jgi:hypothetical protein